MRILILSQKILLNIDKPLIHILWSIDKRNKDEPDGCSLPMYLQPWCLNNNLWEDESKTLLPIDEFIFVEDITKMIEMNKWDGTRICHIHGIGSDN